MLDRPGDSTGVNQAGTRKELTKAAQRAFSVDVAEAFAIRKGQIKKVEALMTSLPYGVKSPVVPKAQ